MSSRIRDGLTKVSTFCPSSLNFEVEKSKTKWLRLLSEHGRFKLSAWHVESFRRCLHSAKIQENVTKVNHSRNNYFFWEFKYSTRRKRSSMKRSSKHRICKLVNRKVIPVSNSNIRFRNYYLIYSLHSGNKIILVKIHSNDVRRNATGYFNIRRSTGIRWRWLHFICDHNGTYFKRSSFRYLF